MDRVLPIILDFPGMLYTSPSFLLHFFIVLLECDRKSHRNHVQNGQIEAREYLNLTLSFDHDIVDGVPATRFTRKLIDLIETATVLEEAFM